MNEGELTKLRPPSVIAGDSASDKDQKPELQKQLNTGPTTLEDGDRVDEDKLSSNDLDEGFDTILKDVLITLRDHPGIIKEIIDGTEFTQL